MDAQFLGETDQVRQRSGIHFLHLLGPVGGDECSDFKNSIGRTFLSGNGIFAETGKSRLSVPAHRSAAFRHAGVKPRPAMSGMGGVLHLRPSILPREIHLLGSGDHAIVHVRTHEAVLIIDPARYVIGLSRHHNSGRTSR